jgi:hypothetical protein
LSKAAEVTVAAANRSVVRPRHDRSGVSWSKLGRKSSQA